MRWSLVWMWLMALLGAEEPKKWVVYYGSQLDYPLFAPYSLVVLEGDHKVSIDPLLEQGKTVLGYLSLGEVSKDRWYFSDVQREGLLLEANSNWPDSYFVDVRRPEWTKWVVERLIPRLLTSHFSGVFLDTVDSMEYLEAQDPVRYAGMKAGVVALIKTIHLHYPQMPIMLNRGFHILPQVALDINMELAESIFSRHDFQTGKEEWVDMEVYQQIAKELKEAQKINPKLQIYTLDYWNLDEVDSVRRIYKTQREQGFIPYVTTLELDQITQEP